MPSGELARLRIKYEEKGWEKQNSGGGLGSPPISRVLSRGLAATGAVILFWSLCGCRKGL